MIEEPIQDTIKSSDLGDYFLQKKVELLIETNNKRIINELNKLNSVISQLDNEVSEIKKKINEKDVQKREPEYTKPIPKSIMENTKKIKDNEDVPKSRYGDYKPGDIDINDFFYFGNKQK